MHFLNPIGQSLTQFFNGNNNIRIISVKTILTMQIIKINGREDFRSIFFF